MPETTKPQAIVTEMSHSPHACLAPVPVNAVTLSDTFWAPRLRINREMTLPSQYRQLQDTGRLDNFQRAAGKSDGPFQGIYFNDSDVYKWLEAAAWSLATHPDDSNLRAMVDEAISLVVAAQDADGYLNTYFSVDRVGERWTNLRDMHELYCAGHLFQAAVAHWRATGERTLLLVATRFADHICDKFGLEDRGKRPGACGHPEIEMALVELFRVTGERRYLDQAQYFIDARGVEPSATYNDLDPQSAGHDRRYRQDHVPFRDLAEVTGHAVRMIYLSCGAMDVYAETGEASLKAALDRQWENMTGRRMYITGGLGARHEGEAFGKDYELPSDRAYAETCAAIANVMWNWRMLAVTGEARYADLMELALYNGVLSGLSLDGKEYFYVNPLSDDGTHRRQPWFGCACCPPNVARLLASLPGYFYSVSEGAVWAHLYASGTADLILPDGGHVALKTETNYPWDGDIRITVLAAPEKPTTLHLRVPTWAGDQAEFVINEEKPAGVNRPGGYVAASHGLKAGDVLRLSLPMRPRLAISHPYVADTYDKAALMYGPLVYCVEQTDYDEVDVRNLSLPSNGQFGGEFVSDLLGGIVKLTGEARELRLSAVWEDLLSQPLRDDVNYGEDRQSGVVALSAIPYYAWANREPGVMRVWLPLG